jgi:tetratricopeptide (TPR) repeat protein
VGVAYDRAWALCQQIGDSPHVFTVLRGRELHELAAGEIPKARDLAEELLRLAEQHRDGAMLVGGRLALAQANFFLGEFTAARMYGEAGIAAYEPREHKFPNWAGGNPGDTCYRWTALAAWMLGFPDRAQQLSEKGLALGCSEESSPFNLVNMLVARAEVHIFRREAANAQAVTETTMEICLEQRIPFWLEWARVVHGWALAAQGHGEDGIAEAHRGLAAFRAWRTNTVHTILLALQAEVQAGLGRPGEALSAIGEAFDIMAKNKGPWWEAELHRLTGELVLAQHDGDQAEAEKAFSQALATARHQKAKSLELRAAMSMARLWQAQGKPDEARDLLAPVYQWFTEGFDTPDLIDAKALLGDLY